MRARLFAVAAAVALLPIGVPAHPRAVAAAGAPCDRANRGGPDPLFQADIPSTERASREDLVKVANMYFSGMQLNDGKGTYPFTDDCDRIENGTQATNNSSVTTEEAVADQSNSAQSSPRPGSGSDLTYSAAWGCKAQFESGLLHFVTRIRDRRFVVIDPERGLVLAFCFFDHAAGKTRSFQLPDGRTVTVGPISPWTWEMSAVFRIEHGRMRRIEAVYHQCPYGMGSGWGSWQDSMSTRARW